jgi:hypothetical protein
MSCEVFGPSDDRATCDDCGQRAVQREVAVRVGTETRHVIYQTHHFDFGGADHHAVHERIAAFHSRAFGLLEKLRALPEAERKLDYGRLVSFDLNTVKPSACAVRSEIIVSATVRVGGCEEEVVLPARPLKGQRVDRILAELRRTAKPLVATLKAKHERLDF